MRKSYQSFISAILRFTLIASASLLPLFAKAQSAVLLNINDSTFPNPCSVTNYQALGIPGLTGSEPISEFAPALNSPLTSPMVFNGGGQVIYLSSTLNGGTWAKSTGAGVTNGLMDGYLFTTTTAPRTMTVSNLNLTAGTSYTLYLIGTIPVSDNAEDGLFQPINTPNISFSGPASGRGVAAFPFSTSAAYSNENNLQFTWAKASSGNGTFQGLAIIPGAPPTQTQTLTITNGVQKYAFLT